MAAESSNRLADDSESEFMWGEKNLQLGNNWWSYKSMRFEGVWYCPDDCVFVKSILGYADHIGKIMSLQENKGKRDMRVRWFLRAEEILDQPQKYDPKEVFIAMGRLKGVEQVIPVVVFSLFLV